MGKLGKAIRIKDRSAFTQHRRNLDALRPDHWKCEGCPQWDDINGCWANCVSIDECVLMGEESHYVDPDWQDEDLEEWEGDWE